MDFRRFFRDHELDSPGIFLCAGGLCEDRSSAGNAGVKPWRLGDRELDQPGASEGIPAPHPRQGGLEGI